MDTIYSYILSFFLWFSEICLYCCIDNKVVTENKLNDHIENNTFNNDLTEYILQHEITSDYHKKIVDVLDIDLDEASEELIDEDSDVSIETCIDGEVSQNPFVDEKTEDLQEPLSQNIETLVTEIHENLIIDSINNYIPTEEFNESTMTKVENIIENIEHNTEESTMTKVENIIENIEHNTEI
jgi:hypothetical protein